MNFKFDFNEWYVLISAMIVMSIFFMIRKHFSNMMILILWLYNVTFVATLDYAIAATPFHLYDCMDNDTYEPMASFAHIFVYTPFTFVFLYFYDKWITSRTKLVLYLTAWTGFAIFFEWVSLKTGFLNYSRGWKLVYSIPTYPISALILIKVYHFLKRNLPGEKAQSINHLLSSHR